MSRMYLRTQPQTGYVGYAGGTGLVAVVPSWVPTSNGRVTRDGASHNAFI